MAHFSPTLAAAIAGTHGIVTLDQMVADGTSIHQVRRLVTAGVLTRCHDGVYRVATSPDTFESRCAAACAAAPGVVVSGPAAARLWQFRHVWRPEQPIVLAPPAAHPIAGPTVVRRTNLLDAADSVLRPDGIRLATPPRAWFDCANDLDDDRFERLTEWVLDKHASVPTLWAMRRRMAGRGRRGLARVNRVLSTRSAWQKPADSGLELIVFNALTRRGIRGLVRQYAIKLPDGVVIHADAALPDIRWALEVDHVTWHGGRLDAQQDKARDRQLRRIGWQVDRVTDVEINAALAATIDELVELIALRRAA